jgi:nucleoside-diphosphate-sugar epimerase
MKGKVLVTGGAGFIGSHLVMRLRDEGYHVTVVDNLSRGRLRNLGMQSPTDRKANLTMYPYPIESLNSLLGCDIVFHLAAKVSNIEYNRYHHLEMMQDNIRINSRMTELVAQYEPEHYTFVSTACVYPHDAPVPTPESAAHCCCPEPTNWGYGVAKWVGEQQARYLHRELDIPTTVVRFFNAFGWNDYYDWESSHVAPALIRKAFESDAIEVWGSGMQTRVLVDAADIAKVLIRLLHCEDHGAHNGQPVNIGHRNEISILELAIRIKNLVDVGKDIWCNDDKPDGYPRRAADPTRLESLIGEFDWTPLNHTLKTMIADYKVQRDVGVLDR